MRKQPKRKPRSTPRTNLRWTPDQYAAASRAAGSIPLATFVKDVFLRSLDRRESAA